MAYLNAPRLIFSGDFLSDVSTVNNDTAHYNNATFQPNFQEFGKGSANGWWNPEGGAVFDFQNCTVQQLALPDGTILSDSSEDILIGRIVSGSEGRPTGKMVDLDPDAQMVSALWCAQLRICTPQNELLLQGDIATTSFRDIQLRQTSGAAVNGQALGASWTSVLTNLVWGEKAENSAFLKILKETTQEDKLALNLNAFGYYYNHAPDGRFSLGRILGSIGPWFKGEPETFAPCRRLYGVLNLKPKNPFVYFGNSNFQVDTAAKMLTIDFGNSFPISDSLGTINTTSTFILGVANNPLSNGASLDIQYLNKSDFIEIGLLDYQAGPDWLNKTGGIVIFENLPEATLQALENRQLVLLSPSATDPTQFGLLARESVDGYLVRADNFVQRIDTGQTNIINFYTYQWGKTLPNATISVSMEAPTPDTPVGPQNPISEIYGNNFPQDGLSYCTSVTTDSDGFGQLSITGNAIHSPRVYLDGQIYTFDYQLPTVDPAFGIENIIVHLRDYYAVPENPVWGDISQTMIQYANLYPIMSKYIVNLANPEDLQLKKNILLFAFSRDINDTMHMPVTRDLSDAKRQTILKWLNNPNMESKTPVFKSDAVSSPENPISPGTPLNEQQMKYKEAVKAKNGSMLSFPEIENPFGNI